MGGFVKMIYKRILIPSFVAVGGAICLLGYIKLHNYHSWAEEKTIIYKEREKIPDDTLRVVWIGDSWAAYHQSQDTTLASILRNRLNRPISVRSSGMVGAKTKAIYELMHDTSSHIGTQKLLEDLPDYCVISAGINDAVAKIGPQNYCYHYSLILKQLISNGITPICIDMPDVDYASVFQKEPLTMKVRHWVSNIVHKTCLWSFTDYRKALKHELSCNNNKKIIYIDATIWNKDGYKDKRHLYLTDKIHLNNTGYHLLDSVIVSKIEKDLSRSTTSNEIQKARN
jgi:hypothetical protein